jgi:hypothetical protein
MRLGMTPEQAAEDAIRPSPRLHRIFTGAVFALRRDGKHAGACHNWVFQYTVRAEGDAKALVFTVQPLNSAALHVPLLFRARLILRYLGCWVLHSLPGQFARGSLRRSAALLFGQDTAASTSRVPLACSR